MCFEPQFQNFPGRLLDPPIKGIGCPPPPYGSDKTTPQLPTQSYSPSTSNFPGDLAGSTLYCYLD